MAPLAAEVVLLDEHGTVRVGTRTPEIDALGIVSGSAPFKLGGHNFTVRVDLPATVLRSRQQSLRVLSWVILGAGAGVSLIVLFFLPRWLAPIDRMLERARGVRREGPRDDVDFLVETFENALELLVRPADVDALEPPEKALARTLTQLGELAAGVAHELRNSLATLRGYLSLIERDPARSSLAEYLGEMRRESDHLQRVLEDFLTFARPGSARLDDVDMFQLLQRAIADPATAETQFRIRAEPAREAMVLGDAQLLERALRNLLRNAARAHASKNPSEPIDIGLAVRPQEIEITIADRGPGFPAVERERLFDPFFTRQPGGVGLGLAVARRIVVLHGGRIALEDRPGGGARAVVMMPRGKSVTKGSGMPADLD
ncbi:MAG: HAMP domain-containing histidine kinase [Thermoanaerobaculia bacterium]|nr:HAMP domain-containing histidine kinase [Thermoanaerobaculia bacterium]